MKKVVAPAGTHTHTAPPRPVIKAPPAGFGGEGGCLGHDTDSRVTDAAARILCAEVPAPWIVLAVIMAANRPHPVAMWARLYRPRMAFGGHPRPLPLGPILKLLCKTLQPIAGVLGGMARRQMPNPP